MDSIELNGDYMDVVSAEQLLSLESSDMSGALGEPGISPRIGSQYQVEIPPLLDNISYTKMLADQEARAHTWDFVVGLPIPIMWVNQGTGSPTNACNAMVLSTGMHLENDNFQEIRSPGYRLVPGTVLDSWTDTEKESFLLGLYIFEKKFVHIKRFVETKRIGDILSFYYGKFYGSHDYRRWSVSRKVRSRKSVNGQKMFSGLRQQELLSRLLPRISEEARKALMEVSKAFGDGKILLEEYVFSLKAMVGINMLIEAVGIGKGKQDLTRMALEPSRSNHATSTRSEVPAGKACCTLANDEIIKFLTGDYRLSKARSHDLFWEAVWPRLLARGWRAEKLQNYPAGPYVFLVSGVKKFSRGLVRGNHYYDSVADVLSKVASDPRILVQDAVDEGIKNKENPDWREEAKLEQDDLLTRQRPLYLQPRTPNQYTDIMKFTVVDTSLSGGKPYKVRELRSLSIEISNKLWFGNNAEEREELSTDESNSVDTSVRNETETNHGNSSRIISKGEMHSDDKCVELSTSSQKFQEASKEVILITPPASGNAPVNNSKNSKRICEDKQSRKVVKAQLKQSSKENNVGHVAHVAKRRRRLTACSRAETDSVMVNSLTVSKLEPDMPSHTSSIIDLSQSHSHIASSQDKLSSSSSSKSSHSQSVECVSDDHHVLEPPSETPKPRIMIDLNEPPVPIDLEDEILLPVMMEEVSGNVKKPEDVHGELKTLTVVASLEQQEPSLNSRRHSTRNRPPTTRALEALADGFLTVNRRQKNSERSRKNSVSRNSQQAPSGMRVTDFSNSTVDSKMERGDDDVSKGGDNTNFGKVQHLPEESGTTTSGAPNVS